MRTGRPAGEVFRTLFEDPELTDEFRAQYGPLADRLRDQFTRPHHGQSESAAARYRAAGGSAGTVAPPAETAVDASEASRPPGPGSAPRAAPFGEPPLVTEPPPVAGPTEPSEPPPAAEAIVERFTRPSLLVIGGTHEAPTAQTWRDRLAAHPRSIRHAIAATGRVEVRGLNAEFVGTAWMLDDRVAVTNRHVAEHFARRANGAYPFLPWVVDAQRPVVVDFLEEFDDPTAAEVTVDEVLFIADHTATEPDLAFLLLSADGPVALPAPVILRPGVTAIGSVVVTVGYPAFDDRNDLEDQERIFGGIYDVKRLAPGRVRAISADAVRHDCTTLGGASGSVVHAPAHDGAVGLHFGGVEGVANHAVSAEVIATYRQRWVDGRLGDGGPTPSRRMDPDQPATDEQPPVPIEELAARPGYDPAFLGGGCEVPFPEPEAGWAGTATPLLDAPDRFHLDVTAARYRAGVEAVVYYVAAEALTNAIRHAAAKVVRIEVIQVADAVRIRVTDDGDGGADPAHGSGLQGLADRGAARGGRLRVTSPPGHGTTIEAVVPCR